MSTLYVDRSVRVVSSVQLFTKVWSMFSVAGAGGGGGGSSDGVGIGGGARVSRSTGGGGSDKLGAAGRPNSSANPQIILLSFIVHPLLTSGLLDYIRQICNVLRLHQYFDVHFVDFSTDQPDTICGLFSQTTDHNAVWLTNLFNMIRRRMDALLTRFVLQQKHGLFIKPKLVFVMQPEVAYQNVLLSGLVHANKLSQEASSCILTTCFDNYMNGILDRFSVKQYYFVLEKNDMDVYNISQHFETLEKRFIIMLYNFISISIVQFQSVYETYNSDSIFVILKHLAKLLVRLLHGRKQVDISEQSLVSIFDLLSKDAVKI